MPYLVIGLAFAGFLVFFAVFNYFLISRFENKDRPGKEKAAVPNDTKAAENGTNPKSETKAAAAADDAKQKIKLRQNPDHQYRQALKGLAKAESLNPPEANKISPDQEYREAIRSMRKPGS